MNSLVKILELKYFLKNKQTNKQKLQTEEKKFGPNNIQSFVGCIKAPAEIYAAKYPLIDWLVD